MGALRGMLAWSGPGGPAGRNILQPPPGRSAQAPALESACSLPGGSPLLAIIIQDPPQAQLPLTDSAVRAQLLGFGVMSRMEVVQLTERPAVLPKIWVRNL